MAEEDPKNPPLKTFSMRTEIDVIERFRRLREEAGLHTDSMMLVELLDRYEDPIKTNGNIKELRQTLEKKETDLAQAKKQAEADKTRINEIELQNAQLKQQLDEANDTARATSEAANAREQELKGQIEGLTLEDNQRVITFTPDNLKVLEYVAARESKRRRQQWSLSHVINWFIFARFVKGMLNGDLGSVDDAELRKMGVKLGTTGKEAVEV